MGIVRYAAFWFARLFTGLVSAAAGCSALVGVGILCDQFAVKDLWIGVTTLTAGVGGIVAAFVLDHRVIRALRRGNLPPVIRGFDVLPPCPRDP